MPAVLPKEAFKQPLNRGFYGTLLKLEEKFIHKLITLEEVVTMAEMYGQIVSYYDTLGDPIKFYFIEKIQVSIAESAAIAMKEKDREKQNATNLAKSNQKQPKPPRSLSASSKSSDQTLTSEFKDTVNQLPEDIMAGLQQHQTEQADERSRTTSITTQKKTRQKKMSLMIQLNKAQEEQPEQYNELLGSYEQSVSKNDQNIKQQLKEQQDTLQQRIESRKKNRVKKAEKQDNGKGGYRTSQSLGQAPVEARVFKEQAADDDAGNDAQDEDSKDP